MSSFTLMCILHHKIILYIDANEVHMMYVTMCTCMIAVYINSHVISACMIVHYYVYSYVFVVTSQTSL